MLEAAIELALMEWQLNKETTVARNIFEMGMTKYGTDAPFLQEYLKFLMDLNEENNIRALFERAITQIQPEKAREIWNMYLTFEFNYGDLATIEKIETRRAAIYPEILYVFQIFELTILQNLEVCCPSSICSVTWICGLAQL